MKKYLMFVLIILISQKSISLLALPPDSPIPASKLCKMIGMGISWDYSITNESGGKVGGMGWNKFIYSKPNYNTDILSYSDAGGRLRIGQPCPPGTMDPTNFVWRQSVLDQIEEIIDYHISLGLPVAISLGEVEMITWVSNNQGNYNVPNFTSYSNLLMYAATNEWKYLLHYFKDKSHLLFFDFFIEYQGGKNILNSQQQVNVLNAIYDKLTEMARRENPTRVLSYKPWGVARDDLYELTIPYGPDTADPTNGYYMASFGGMASGPPDSDGDCIWSETEKDLTLERALNPTVRWRQTNNNTPVWCSVWGYITNSSKPECIEMEYRDWYMQYLKQFELGAAESQFRNFYPGKDVPPAVWTDTNIRNLFKKYKWKDKKIWFDTYPLMITVSASTMINLNPENTGKLLAHSTSELGNYVRITFSDKYIDATHKLRTFTITDLEGNKEIYLQRIKVTDILNWPGPPTYTNYTIGTSNATVYKENTSNNSITSNTFKIMPNPFTRSDGEVVIHYYNTNPNDDVKFEIYTITGTFVKEIKPISDYEAKWDGKNNIGQEVANGIYLIIMRVNGEKVYKPLKIIYLKK